MPACRTPVPNIAGLPASHCIDLSSAVAFIARHVRKQGETDRRARDRVRKLIGYHVEKGWLTEAAPRKFALNEFGRWLHGREDWTGKFANIPANVLIEPPAASLSLTPPPPELPRGAALPTNLEDSHHLINDLIAEINQLRREKEAAIAKIRDLEPVALKRRERSRKAVVAGKQRGRGKAK